MFIILISLLLLFGPPFKVQTAAQKLPKNEVDAVTHILERFDLSKIKPAVFKFNNSSCNDANMMSYIFCDCTYDDNRTCHITEIVWESVGLTGTVPKELATFTHLEILDLRDNKLNGAVPDFLGNMTSLFYLDLAGNQLTGPIPNNLGNLKAHVKRILKANPEKVDRADSDRYVTCPALILDLSGNQLDGLIPESLGNIKLNLTEYGGKILEPTDNYCITLQTFLIDLSYNQLNGIIPASFGKLKYLNALYVDNNNLSGSLPHTLGNLSFLGTLFLSSNNFAGSLPETYGQLRSIRSFKISGNSLSGPFPNFITNWSSTPFEILSLCGNDFSGNIPQAIFNNTPTRLIICEVANNYFQFPSSAKNLKNAKLLVLRNCSITGSVPDYIGNMTNLEYLDLSFNKLTGHIPESWQNSTSNSLNYMSLAHNELSDTIPHWIQTAASSTKIDLSYNNFSKLPFEDPKSSNLSLFSCCWFAPKTMINEADQLKMQNYSVAQLRMKYCPRHSKYDSLYINCGGEDGNLNEHAYESDNDSSTFYVSPKGNWAYSSAQSYLVGAINSSDYIKRTCVQDSDPDTLLYENARFAPISLTYYGFCLHNGKYNVTLYFAEIEFTEDRGLRRSMNKRVFDIYVQGNIVRKDYCIIDEARGPNNRTRVNLTPIDVENNTLTIHLYWAGKGSSDKTYKERDDYDQYLPDFNGPLISAISVTRDSKPGKKLSPVYIALITVASVIFVLLLLLAFAWMMGWLDKELSHEIRVGEDKTVTLKQLRDATRRFSKVMEIGRGSFGTVYRAELPDHQIVAVKNLTTLSAEGINKLKSEFYTLQSLSHENLVRLFDIYVGKGLYLLIYEYMENRSLADALFNPKHKVTLDWDARFNICLGVAKGLEYLHEHPRFKMVHRGIKAANILLDRTLKSKISDFGLASAYEQDDNDAIRVLKTEAPHGYMAPEYPMYGTISRKYDVYSFGVVILELVSGRKNASHKDNQELAFLVDEVCVADTKGRLLDLVDKSLRVYETKQALTILKLAVKCIHISPGVRPTMSQVVGVLTGEKTLEEISMREGSVEDDNNAGQDIVEDLPRDVESSTSA